MSLIEINSYLRRSSRVSRRIEKEQEDNYEENNAGDRELIKRKTIRKKIFDPSEETNCKPKRQKADETSPSTEKIIAPIDENIEKKSCKINVTGCRSASICLICANAILDVRPVGCGFCTQKAHRSCLTNARFLQNKWQCEMCRKCSTDKDDAMDAYCPSEEARHHVSCHFITNKPTETSSLATPLKYPVPVISLLSDDEDSSNESSCAESRPASKKAPIVDAPSKVQRPTNDDDDSLMIPDVSRWSTKDVFEFFQKLFPGEAHVFEDEGIDGSALLLMDKNDVINNGLHLKLGPGLKIYAEIRKLQAISAKK